MAERTLHEELVSGAFEMEKNIAALDVEVKTTLINHKASQDSLVEKKSLTFSGTNLLLWVAAYEPLAYASS